jgi:predicted transcriptional regulator
MSKHTTSTSENATSPPTAKADKGGLDKKTAKQASDSSTSTKRMTVVLPADTAEMLELLSEVQSISLNEAIRRAISTEAYIQTEIRKKSRVLIETERGETKELVFR